MAKTAKKLLRFALFFAVVGGIVHLIRVHDQTIPLSEKQISLLNATHYASERDIQIVGSKEENAIGERINSLRAKRGLVPLNLDKSATLLALHHSALMRKKGKLGFHLPDYITLEARTTNVGISDTCFYALYVDISISRMLKQIEQQEGQIHAQRGLTHMGIGVVHQLFPWRYWVTVIYIKRLALLDEFPTYIPRAYSMKTLHWKLAENYTEPQVKMITPAGEIEEIAVKKLTGREYEAEIPFWKQGKYIIQIVANGPYGTEGAHVLPVYVQIEREKELTPRRYYSPDVGEESLEKLMFALMNLDRIRHGLKPLQVSSSLREVARIHSRNMEKNNKTVHDIPGCPNLSERLQDAHLKVLKQAENIASDDSIEGAEENLMKSPGHRQAILDPDFTHAGIGIVKQKNLLFITQNFASFIPEISPSEGKGELLRRINKIASSRLGENPPLSSIAQRHSEKMAASGRLLKTEGLVDTLASGGISFSRVSFLVIASPTIQQIVEETEKNQDIRSGSMKEIGIGLRQSDDGNLWVTIILKK